MKLSTWICFLLLAVGLVYFNVWFDHMALTWAARWWYATTQVVGIIVNIFVTLVVLIPAMVWFENEYGFDQ